MGPTEKHLPIGIATGHPETPSSGLSGVGGAMSTLGSKGTWEGPEPVCCSQETKAMVSSKCVYFQITQVLMSMHPPAHLTFAFYNLILEKVQ